MIISQEDMIVLEEAKIANPWYFSILVWSAKVVSQRRGKWSGANPNPFVNFQRMAEIRQATVDEAFLWMLAVKESRQSIVDYADDSWMDNIIDRANYLLLWAGYKIFVKERDMADEQLRSAQD